MPVSITVYGRHDCVQCRATARALEKLGLPFFYVDLDEDFAAEARLVAAGHRALPVVEAGDQTWAGFHPDLIGKLRIHDA